MSNPAASRSGATDDPLTVRASEIARFLGAPLVGADVVVTHPRPLEDPEPGGLLFASAFSGPLAEKLDEAKGSFVLAAPGYAGHLHIAHVLVEKPRLAFARVMQRWFAPPAPQGIDPSARVAATAHIGEAVSIGAFAVIGEGVVIGARTRIDEHVVIRPHTKIGSRCRIGAGTVIGEEGYGFELDEEMIPVRLPHIGGVLVGDDVEIGPLCVVYRGTLTDTVVGAHVKVDGHVIIGHNVQIGEKTMIIGGTEISGSVKIGARAWISPQAAILEKLTIGDDAMVGIGAVVLRPVGAAEVVSGNPARPVGTRRNPGP